MVQNVFNRLSAHVTMAVALLHSSVGFFSALDTRFIERQGGVAAHPLLSTQFFQAAFSVSQSAPP